MQDPTNSDVIWRANSYSHAPHPTARGVDTVGGPLVTGVRLPGIPYHKRADDVPVVSIRIARIGPRLWPWLRVSGAG